MPLPKFTDEAQFRKEWIRPFLSKLGYILVPHTHGPNEQGKDFYFADQDRFDNFRFYAVQAKLGDIGVGADTEELIRQTTTCFDVPIWYRGQEKRVSAVYVVTDGKITYQAEKRILHHFRQEHFGENVHLLDGAKLEALERRTAMGEG